MSTDHAKFMALAIEESRKGLRAGERPFGAVVVRGEQIVARAYAIVDSSGDPTTHAETLAVRAATAYLKSPSLKTVRSILLATLVPCAPGRCSILISTGSSLAPPPRRSRVSPGGRRGATPSKS